MTTFEDLFNRSLLCVIAPEASLGFPNQEDVACWPEWLTRLQAENTDRKLAFFDEQLEFLLTLQFEQSSYAGDVDPQKPPPQLLSYLAHLQVSYEASYISSITQGPPAGSSDSARPGIPPRTHSITLAGRSSNKPSPLAPGPSSIFPPHTPHPIPSTAEADKQYVQAQGVPLRSGVWGEGTPSSMSGPLEKFALVWSASSYSWIAVFLMSIQVAFVPTKMSDPLLCLTVSTTLREKPVAVTEARQPLAALLKAAEGSVPEDGQSTPAMQSPGSEEQFDSIVLQEINLLEGLSPAPTFDTSDSPLLLPSTRLGFTARHQAFALPSFSGNTSSPPMQTPLSSRTGPSHPTLRKSFRKTLRTVSGFHVRMRTVFVPYFMLPKAAQKSVQRTLDWREDHSNESDGEQNTEHLRERELLESGTEEHTVVLCIEVENGGEADSGFALEGVKVTVSGEGAQTHLIGWGDAGLSCPQSMFPLLLGPQEQYNLLYAVTFVGSPEVDEFSLAKRRNPPGKSIVQELQRAVTIIISGRPYNLSDDVSSEDSRDPSKFVYPTRTFPSRWNCVLDLSPQVSEPGKPEDTSENIALPTPATPFPYPAIRDASSRPTPSFALSILARGSTSGSGSGSGSGYNTPITVIAGSKRHTLGALEIEQAGLSSPVDHPKHRSVPSPVNYRTGASLLNPVNQRDPIAQTGTIPSRSSTPTLALSINPTPPSRTAYLPPSVTAKSFAPLRTPGTTYGVLSSPLPSVPSMSRISSYTHVQDDSISGQISLDGIPPTPAYPAFPASSPPVTMHWQSPLASLQSGPVGPSVEIRREKGPNAAGIPPTPGPRLSAAGAFAQSDSLRDVVNSDGLGEPIVVSVGLLRRIDEEETATGPQGRIYPLDKFTLDIFVFNRSSWTRRFEVSYPDRRTRRKEQMLADGVSGRQKDASNPGVISLENRVRVGPLLPSTCQSVRMDFLALSPGVHSIQSLLLTDVQSGFIMTLRSVMDIVVHEPGLPYHTTSTDLETLR